MKFFKKKGVRIAMIVTSVVLLALIVYFCVRPVSVGYSYTGKTKNLLGQEVTSTYHFDSFNKVTINDVQNWYFEKDNLVVTLGLAELVDKDAYEANKETALDNWNYDIAKIANPEFSAFGAEILGVKYTCVGAIVTVVVMSVVEIGLITLLVMSFMGKSKKRKK